MASASENSTVSSSRFTSIFARKKRVNGTKLPDNSKTTATAAAVKGDTEASTNGFLDADLDEFASSQRPQMQQNGVGKKVSYGKNEKRHEHHFDSGVLSDGDIPNYSRTLPVTLTNGHGDGGAKKQRQRGSRDHQHRLSGLLNSMKAMSADEIYLTDSNMLVEALETLGEEQPRVARSIPKHAVVDTSAFVSRSLNNCLFDASVYESMLDESMKVCDLLQTHLNECIVTVRAKSPERRPLSRVDEEERENEDDGHDRPKHKLDHNNRVQKSSTNELSMRSSKPMSKSPMKPVVRQQRLY